MTIKERTFFQILLISIIGMSAFGCSANTGPVSSSTLSPEQMDRSPFTGVPCAAPCWYGLEVGKSKESDVIELLPSLTFINIDSIQMFRTSMPNYDFTAAAPGVNIVANCINSNEECLKLRVVDDVLTRIVVDFNYEIEVDEAIEYLGNPAHIGIAPAGPENFVCEVYLVWKDIGLALVSTFEAQKSNEAVKKYCDVVYKTGKVPSSMMVLEARYLSDAEFGAIMSPTSSNTFFEFTGTIPEK